MPEQGGVLEPTHRHIHDSGRRVYAELPFLRYAERGRPLPGPIPTEPRKVRGERQDDGLRHVVLTSVTRDDLPDHGAAHWAATVSAVREMNPEATIELLISDFDARPELLDTVIASKPDIIGHNIETVERLTPLVRSRATYATSLRTLRYLADRGAIAKSGLMVGSAKAMKRWLRALADLRGRECVS